MPSINYNQFTPAVIYREGQFIIHLKDNKDLKLSLEEGLRVIFRLAVQVEKSKFDSISFGKRKLNFIFTDLTATEECIKEAHRIKRFFLKALTLDQYYDGYTTPVIPVAEDEDDRDHTRMALSELSIWTDEKDDKLTLCALKSFPEYRFFDCARCKKKGLQKIGKWITL